MDNFKDWLASELKNRRWRQADLVRESGLDSAVISNLINGKRKPGETTVRAISKAFGLPQETVFEAAGIMKPTYDPNGNHTPSFREWVKIYDDADEDTKKEMLEYARYLSNRKSANKQQTS